MIRAATLSTLPLKRLGLNSLWLLLARVLTQLVSLVFTAVIARLLGASGYGQYAIVTSIVFIGNAFTTFGTDTLLIRETARTREPDGRLLSAALYIQLVLSFLFIGFAILSDGADLALSLYSLALVPLAFYSVYTAVLRGHERMDLYLLLNLSGAVLQIVCAAAVWVLQAGLLSLLFALVISQALLAALAWSLARPYMSGQLFPYPPRALGVTLRAALPFALLTTLALANRRMGLFALGMRSGNDAAGWFSAASRIVEASKLLPQVLLGALLPMLMPMVAGRGALRLTRLSLVLSLAFCSIAALLLTILAPPLVNSIFGQSFLPAVSALEILSWSLIPYALTANLTLAMISQGHEWSVLRLTLAGVLISLLLLALLVPRLGLLGACWASLIAEAIQAILYLAWNRTGARAG